MAHYKENKQMIKKENYKLELETNLCKMNKSFLMWRGLGEVGFLVALPRWNYCF